MSDNIQTILPIMFAPLHEHSKGHWNRYLHPHHPSILGKRELTFDRTIHGLLYTALKSLIDMDPDLYNKCELEYEQSQLTREHESQERHHRWQIIEQQALKCQPPHHNDILSTTNHIDPSPQEMQLDKPPTPQPQPVINVPEKIPEVQEESGSEVGVVVEHDMRGVPSSQEENDTSMSVDPVETVELPPV